MNELIIKTYDIDYSFIVKNYLDKELWHKEWTLFVYKDFVFTISLDSIDVRNEKILFRIYIKNKEYENYSWINYYINQSSIKILKQQINGEIFRLVESCENYYIRNEDGYKTIRDAESEEEDMLTQIAEEFLDDNGVSNKEIREVYIDNYVSNNKKTDVYLSNYLSGRKYCVLSDLYLVHTKITEDETRYNNVLEKIKNENKYMETLEEVNIYINKLQNEEEQEELIEEFKDCLEAI